MVQSLLFWKPKRPYLWRAACLVSVAMIAYADQILPQPLSLAVFYLPIILLASWLAGRTFGIIVVLAALVGWMSDHMVVITYHNPFYYFWDLLIRFVTWGILVWLVVELKAALLRADDRFIALLKSWDSAVCVSSLQSGALLYMNESCATAFSDNVPLNNLRQIDARLTPSPLETFSDGKLQEAVSSADNREVLECRDTITGRWYLVRAYLLRWINGGMERIQIATDITEYKRIQQINRNQQEKLELSSRLITLGGMAATLAHELNQPLAAIANYTRGSMQRLRAGNTDHEILIEAMEKSAQQIERAGAIIRRARGMAQRRAPQLETLDLNTAIAGIKEVIEDSTSKSGVSLTLELAPSLPPIHADRVMLEQLILNLTRNAVDAMKNEPAPQKSLKILTRYDTANSLVELQVIDSGSGLPPQLADNLFQPFFTTKTDGLGLGLNLCRSIAELHHGRLQASRNPAGGSILHFSVPAETP